MGECRCRGPGYCATRGRNISKAGLAVCRTGSPGMVARYFGTAPAPAARGPGVRTLDRDAIVSTAQLAADSLELAAKLPADVDLVVGIARSGLTPASVAATLRHVPLWTVSGVRPPAPAGSGQRMGAGAEPRPAPRRIALIDDTAATGREMGRQARAVSAAFPGVPVTRAVVYATPRAASAVDLYVAVLPGPHYLEWNWPNAGHGQACGYDFDGILCEEIRREDCDDGPRYLEALRSARPLYLPRRAPIPIVVTARAEQYRAVTEDWLNRHGVRVERLVMRDWDFDGGRFDPIAVGRWKAAKFRAARLNLVAESDPVQARIVADHAGVRVLCPALGRVLTPDSSPGLARKARNYTRSKVRHVAAGSPPTPPEELDRRRAICAGCEHRTAEDTCRKCGCPLKDKIAWALERCPVGKWDRPAPEVVELAVAPHREGAGGVQAGDAPGPAGDVEDHVPAPVATQGDGGEVAPGVGEVQEVDQGVAGRHGPERLGAERAGEALGEPEAEAADRHADGLAPRGLDRDGPAGGRVREADQGGLPAFP